MRGPLRHFFCFVQEQAKNANIGQVVLKLVTFKLDELQNEYRNLLNRINEIVRRAAELSGCDRLFKDDPASMTSLALIARKVCYQQWAAFQRRIYIPMQQHHGSF